MATGKSTRFVSRGGEKLHAALDAFALDPAGWDCADFGANVGGFTDCLLQRGARRVWAVDTGYGDLAWTLRKDPRVEVLERTNVLHCDAAGPVDLVVADVAWTPQRLVLPAAARWLSAGARGGVVSLLKPHYEMAKIRGKRPHRPLSEEESHEICMTVCNELIESGWSVSALTVSVLRGKGGNAEYLLWVRPGGAVVDGALGT